MSNAILTVQSMEKSFGALKVADRINIEVRPNEILGVIGPNGAGKTTLFGMIAGDIRADAGTILLNNERVEHLGPERRAQRGLARTFQIPKPFTHMKVIDNLRVAAIYGAGLNPGEAEIAVDAVLTQTHLTGVANELAGALPLLSRKRLEFGRALATQPRVLLLDEIAGGLTDPEVNEFIYLIASIRDTGVAIVWIEHIIWAITGAADRLVALNQGRVVVDGDPQMVFEHPEVRRVYTGS